MGTKRGPYKKANPEPRFWEKVDPDAVTGCWNWTASKTASGYGSFGMWPKLVSSHRFAWELLVGPIPAGMQLDHVCHNPSCCNPMHLRVATHAENTRNALKPVTNTSGFKGVTFCRSTGRWRAQINSGCKHYNLGRFNTPEDAHSAYCEAAHRLHGEFANEGFAAGMASGHVGGRIR